MMKDMFTYEEPLNILGLKDGFTESELKKNYRLLTKQFHPDLNDDSEEITQQMKKYNEAERILRNFLNSQKDNQYTGSQTSIEEYKEKKYEQFKKSVHYQEVDDISDEQFRKRLKLLLYDTEMHIKVAQDMKNVDDEVDRAYQKFDKLLSQQVDSFCLQHGLTEQNLNQYFNLKLEIEKRNPNELCSKLNEALQKIKALKIEEIINKYTGYAGYDSIADKIEDFKQKAIKSDCTILSIMIELQENINQAFKNYFENIGLLNELNELIKSTDNPELLEEIKELTTKVSSDDFRSLYYNLKRKILDYNELKTLERLFNDINEKGADALKSCQSMDETIQIYTTFSKISELLNKIKEKQIPITEKLKNMLNWETLNNFNDDIDMLNLSDHPDIDNIYVKVKGFENKSDIRSFFIKKGDFLFKIYDDTFTGEVVVKNENFIPLSEFLAEVKIEDKFCDENSFLYSGDIIYQICTYKDGRSICLVMRKFIGDILSKIEIYDSKTLVTTSRCNRLEEQCHKYTNMQYLTQAISEQLNKFLDEEIANQDNRGSIPFNKKA